MSNKKKLEAARHDHARLLTATQLAFKENPSDTENWTPEQTELYAKQDADLSALEIGMQELRTAVERDERMASRADMAIESNARDLRDDPEGFKKEADLDKRQEEAFGAYLRQGEHLPMEKRALLAGDQSSAGLLTPPEKIVARILKEMDDAFVIRQMSFTQTVAESQDLGVVNQTEDYTDFEWTTEIKEPVVGPDMSVEPRHFIPHYAEKLVKASSQFVRSVPTAEQWIRSRIAYRAGNTQENVFMNGTGSKQPLGIFTPSINGIPSTRWFSQYNTTTKVSAKNLVAAQGEIKAGYKPKWLFGRDMLTAIRLLEDGNGQFIFNPGLTEGSPATLLGEQFVLSEFAPKTFTTGLPVYCRGDFSYYWIVDSLRMLFQVFVEKYGPKFIGYYFQFATDAQPVQAEAFTIGALA